jgi:hypothetical protein
MPNDEHVAMLARGATAWNADVAPNDNPLWSSRDLPASAFAKAKSPFRDRGTDGSNPSPSSRESANEPCGGCRLPGSYDCRAKHRRVQEYRCVEEAAHGRNLQRDIMDRYWAHDIPEIVCWNRLSDPHHQLIVEERLPPPELTKPLAR